MSNTLDANLITDTLAERALSTLPSALNALRVFSTDFSDERVDSNAVGGGPRQTLQVELVKTAGSVLTNPTNFEVTATENAAVAVALNHLSRPIGLSVQDLNQGRRLGTKAVKALEAIANAVADACMSLVTTTNYETDPVVVATTGTDGAFDDKVLKAMWAAISNGRQKNAVLSGQSYANFLPKNLDEYQIDGGNVGVFGFDNFAFNNRFAAAGEGIVAFSCDPSAMAIASRLPADPGDAKDRDYIVSDVVTVDPLGIAVEYNVWFSRATRGHWLSYDIVFGAAVGDDTALVPVLESAPSSS